MSISMGTANKNWKCGKGTTAKSVMLWNPLPKLIVKSLTSLFMAIFTSSDWWRPFSSINSWHQEVKGLLQQDLGTTAPCGWFCYLKLCEKRVPGALPDSHSYLWVHFSSSVFQNGQPIRPHKPLSTKAAPFCWNPENNDYQSVLEWKFQLRHRDTTDTRYQSVLSKRTKCWFWKAAAENQFHGWFSVNISKDQAS